MNVAVITDNTFNKAYLKKYIEQNGKYTVDCIFPNSEIAQVYLRKSEFDVIIIDYYNKSISTYEISTIADSSPNAVIVLLADVDDKEEMSLLKSLRAEYLTIYNLKNPPSESDFVEHLDAMFEAKTEEANPLIAKFLWGIVILIIVLGSLCSFFAK